MSQINTEEIKKFINKLNFIIINQIKTVKSGKNSKIYKINTDKKKIILKSYYGKKNLRIRKEFQFYKYLNQTNIDNVVTPIAFDFKNNLVALPYIVGNKIHKVQNKHIIQLSNFINKINQKNIYSRKIGLAVEGINNRKNHITICQNRINKLKLVDKKSAIKKKLYFFLREKIIPTFKILKNKINDKKILCQSKYKLYKKDMIISPSDFGFHNVIESKKKIFFFDFEYGGYDDPVKLICDFYCQPNQKVSIKQKEKFKKMIIKKYKNYKQLDYLISELLPIHHLKWCCIILNEFIPSKLSIRKHAGQLKNDVLQSQLIKAKNYFNHYLKV
jgi:hypothetical protein